MRYFSFLFFCSIILGSCAPIIEKHITMNDFNKRVSLKKKQLEVPMYVELMYDPKINIHIDKQFGFFLEGVDSVYVNNIHDYLIQELEKVNIIVSNEGAPASLSIDEVSLIENMTEGSDSDSRSTTETYVKLSMKGYLHQRSSDKKHFVEAVIENTTTTGLSFFSILLDSSDFDVQKNNTYEKGMAEKNLITLFVEQCVQKIH